jgi:hypothetical protein
LLRSNPRNQRQQIKPRRDVENHRVRDQIYREDAIENGGHLSLLPNHSALFNSVKERGSDGAFTLSTKDYQLYALAVIHIFFDEGSAHPEKYRGATVFKFVTGRASQVVINSLAYSQVSWLFHCLIPAARWWDDIVTTCFSSGRKNRFDSGAPRMMDQLWTLATTWYSTRLQENSQRPQPDEMRFIFAGLGLAGDFWDPHSDTFG